MAIRLLAGLNGDFLDEESAIAATPRAAIRFGELTVADGLCDSRVARSLHAFELPELCMQFHVFIPPVRVDPAVPAA